MIYGFEDFPDFLACMAELIAGFSAVYAACLPLRKLIAKHFNIKYCTTKQRVDKMERDMLRDRLWNIYKELPSEGSVKKGIVVHERETYARYNLLGGNHEIDEIRNEWYKRQIDLNKGAI